MQKHKPGETCQAHPEKSACNIRKYHCSHMSDPAIQMPRQSRRSPRNSKLIQLCFFAERKIRFRPFLKRDFAHRFQAQHHVTYTLLIPSSLNCVHPQKQIASKVSNLVLMTTSRTFAARYLFRITELSCNANYS